MNIRKNQSKVYLSILLVLLPLLANAQVKIDSIWYNLDTESMTAEVIKNPLGFGYYLSSVTIPSTVTYEETIYNVTRIGNNAFKSGVILTSITIPACVTSIGDEAFYECSNLVDVSFSEGVTSIGKNAFYQCSSLTEITIPASVMNIGFGAFSYCSGLTSITVDERNSAYDSRENCNAIIKTSSNSLIAGCSTTTIPESVTSIGGVAFANFTNITEITIPANVTSIGPSAFYNCKNLSEIAIPANVESVGRSAFEGTPWFDNLSEGVVYVGNTLYAYKGSMPEETSIDVREGTKSITDKAFYEQGNLSSITIPASVAKIGDAAFQNCISLSSIIVAEGNTIYDSRGGCNAIIETSTNALLLGCSATIIPEDVTSIGNAAFWGCSGLSEITIPASVKSIGAKAFQSCRYLTSVVISEGVDSIGDLAFSSCNRLNSIILPTSIKDIGNSTFLNCSNLTSIVIPEGLSHITDGMFYGCTNLNEIIIPEGVKSIGWDAFRECVSLREIIIPSSVTSIGNEAFYGCSNLTNITIPKGVKTIGSETFRGCSNLTSIILPEGMTSIGESALYGCISLTEITIPYGVTSIGESAFYFCNSLTSITIPASITKIARFAFVGCEKLHDVYCYAEELPSSTEGIALIQNIDSVTLHVPASALEAYKTTAPWSKFGTIVAMEESKPYLVTEGKEWAVERYTMGGVQGVYSYCLQGDTIINGKEYKIEHEGCGKDLSGMKPSGRYMREENGRVYSYVHTERYKDEDEVLFFDFNLEDGDTIVYIPDVYSLHVIDVYDAVVPHSDGQSRKCYEVELWNIREEGVYDSDDFGGTFVEGIGNLCSGLSDPGFGLVGSNQRLLYVKQGDTMLYQREEENPKEQSKFFADDTKWYGEEDYVYYSSHHRTSISYSLGTDTVIDGQLGQTLYRDGEYQGTFFVKGESVWFKPSTIFSWFINIEEEEELPTFLLYDFSLQVGDTIFYDERSLGYTYEKTEEYSPNLVVKAVREVHGRKVIDFDDGEQWIEGIGSIREPFLERWRPRLVGPGNTYESIYQVVADSATIWFKGELANPNIEPWLKAGMTWTENKQYNEGEDYVSHQIKLGKGSLPGRFSVSITGMDSWEKPFYELQVFNDKVYGLGMNSIILCYDFSLSVGNKVSLLKSYNYGLDNCYYYYDNCHVTKVDTVVYYGVPRKRITLSGDRDDVWVEGIGSLTRLFPLDNLDPGGDYSIMANYSKVVECSYKGNLLYRKDDLEITRPTIKRGYGLYHSDSYLHAYTINEAVGVTDSTDFARWNNRTVIRIDVDTIGPNAFSGATFRQGQIICFSDRLNTICKDAFAGINIVKRTSQEAPQISGDLTLVFEGTNPPGIDKNNILDYSDSTCHINFVVPDMATYIAEDNQWTYTTLMTIDDFIKGYVSSENEVTVTDPTEVTITDVEEGELSGGVENSSLVVVVEARPRKDIPVRIGDGENKDIYSRAPAWQRYTVELKVTDSSEALLYEGAMACSASDVCVFDVTLPCRPDDDVIYLHSRSIDMFDRATEWATRAVTLTRIEDVKTLDSDTYYDLQGRKVTHPTRGVYIKNGRKVIVK